MIRWFWEKIASATGAMLTGDKIREEIEAGNIKISDFSTDKLNPNSYNISTGSIIKMYRNITCIDLKNPETYQDTYTIDLGEDGVVLRPGHLYLIPTKEIIKADKYIPMITGRSSIGRLGISVHQEAGFGDIGYMGVWTMQLKVTYPTKIYPNLPIAQVYFLTSCGRVATIYRGKYQGSIDAVSSKWKNAG